jgi:hypothetical protein
MPNSSYDEDDNFVKAEEDNSQRNSIWSKRQFQDTTVDVSERLTSIAELEWSDEEDNLTNQTPPALLESAPPEQAPVMPQRFESEVLEA